MNILFLINFAGQGGSEKYVKDLMESLIHKNDNVILVYNEKGLLVEQVKNLGVKTIKLNMKNPFDIFSAIKLKNICIENNINIIHTQFARENYIAIFSKLLGAKIKIIYTSHINLNNNCFWKFTNKILIKQNSYIIAVCNSVKQLLIKNNYPSNKIKVIFNGVDFDEKLIKAKPYIRNEFSISKEEFVFVTLTRFSEEKGNMFLLKSIKYLSNITNIPFRVIFVGDGILLEESKNFVNQNNLENKVIFTGYRIDTKNILDESNVFINSSSSEALSFAIIEALSRGIPAIVTNVGGNIDIINDRTNCGLVVNYNDISAMANAMNTMLNEKEVYYNFCKNSREAVKINFDKSKNFDKTYDLYLNSIERRKK